MTKTAMDALQESKRKEKEFMKEKIDGYNSAWGKTPNPEPTPGLDTAAAENIILKNLPTHTSELRIRQPHIFKAALEKIDTKAKAAALQYKIADINEFMKDGKRSNELAQNDKYAYSLISAAHRNKR